ncbi:MAG TPA: tetratricopeptide repeat protein [Candidatus Acidoferrum sp.]|nr:tetratricopeptide repeat protein [Candidatus Acidoferrum sp.]
MGAFAQATQYQLEGRFDAARRLYRKVLEREPRHFGALNNLGVLAFCQRDLATARTMLERAVAHPEHNAACHGVFAATLLLMGAGEQAQQELNLAVRLDPNSAEPYYFVGVALKERGSVRDSVLCLEQAVRLNPQHESARNDLGVALLEAGRLDEARACFEQVGGAMGLANLAHVHRAGKLWGKAVECMRQAIALQPDNALLWSNLAAFLQADHQYVESLTSGGKAVKLASSSPEAWVALGNGQCFLGLHEEAVHAYTKAAQLGPSRTEFAQNLLFMRHYTGGLTPAAHATQHIEWAKRFAPAPSQRYFANAPDPARRLRVGYVSGDLRAHPVGYGLAPVLEAHDPREVETFCYASGTPDAWTERMRTAAAHWRTTDRLDHGQLERAVLEDEIDLLIDLSGHTPGNRLAVFARKPAPVQATWLGYFNTTGLGTMDYLIADAQLAPEGETPGFAEETLRIEGCRFAWQLLTGLPEVTPPPCVERGYTTYGAFHKLAKVGLPVIETWAQVLLANPGSRLVMKSKAFVDPECRTVYQAHFARFGVTAGRVDLLGPSPYAEYLQAFQNIDIALDAFPYSGETTTCEALQMGVPVIALRGDRFVGRLGATVLHNAGFGEWIAEDRADYVRLAVEWGRDAARLAQVRTGMRERLASSTLCDVAGFTRKLEAAYRTMWAQWCGRVG